MRRAIFAMGLMAATFGIGLTAPPGAIAQQTAAPPTAIEVLDIVFSEVEKRIIREHFGTLGQDDRDDRGHLPPGLAKKDKLPPGIAKKLRRDGSLPPGLAKRQLPDDLASRLPKRKGGFEPVIVDSDVVLIEKITGRVLDVIAGAAKPEPKPSRR